MSRREEPWLSNSQITWCSGTVSALAATFSKQPIQRVKWIRQTTEGYRPYSSIVRPARVPHHTLVSKGSDHVFPARAQVRETLQTQGYRGFFAGRAAAPIPIPLAAPPLARRAHAPPPLRAGSAAGVYRNVPHSVLVYSLYPHAADLTRRVLRGGTEESFWTRFVAGYVTMVGATIVTHPLDTLRVRVSVQSQKQGFLEAAARLQKLEGLSGFYGGFGATLVGAGPRGAIGFAVFESAKPLAAEHELLRERPALAKVVCGYVAGLCSESFVYPLDTVRRRQQALGAAHPISRLSIFAALASIFRNEGLNGLFKGISLNLIKNPAGTAVSFTVNDLVKDLLGYDKSGALSR